MDSKPKDPEFSDSDGEEDYSESKTLRDQRRVEKIILEMFQDVEFKVGDPHEHHRKYNLFKTLHAAWVSRSIEGIPGGFQVLDAGQPWFFFWMYNTLDLLNTKGYELTDSQKTRTIDYLRACQHPKGGFGGGPHQLPHLASNYAAVNALMILDTEEAYTIVDRQGMYNFFMSVKQEDGSLVIHEDGESDMRGIYCAFAVAKILNILDDKLTHKTGDYIAKCQTYEGGIAGEPFTEAHGGYGFCGLAALVLADQVDSINLDALLKWAVARQMENEGGFQGRTNKLVDSCYNYWVGALFYLCDIASKGRMNYKGRWLFDQEALQAYCLICCQNPDGGMIDKPGKSADYYHTNYSLSGLTVAQHSRSVSLPEYGYTLDETEGQKVFLGHNDDNELSITDPIYNILLPKVRKAREFYLNQPDISR